MADIPESLLRRSAEAKAKALGVPVEQVLAEMKGEAPPTPPPSTQAEPPASEPATPAADVEQVDEGATEEPETETPAAEIETPAEEDIETAPPTPEAEPPPAAAEEVPPSAADTETDTASPVATATEDPPAVEPTGPDANGAGNGAGGNGARQAAVVSARPVAPPANAPEGVRTQRLLTVVKARAIQNVKAEPQDKVNTWPHLVIAEFTALMAMTAFLLILSVILQAPLLEPANFNATPNPSKAPWYFLGLQELLSYFDPQIAGVTVPTIVGLVGFMMIPYVDKNPSNKPSDRKFAIMLYTIFLTGSAVLTIIGVLFRGQGFNWAYPWRDGVFFDDLKDWVHFE
jgi:menaquinol-cytochrome c reductase cytochrome b/c subunit